MDLFIFARMDVTMIGFGNYDGFDKSQAVPYINNE